MDLLFHLSSYGYAHLIESFFIRYAESFYVYSGSDWIPSYIYISNLCGCLTLIAFSLLIFLFFSLYVHFPSPSHLMCRKYFKDIPIYFPLCTFWWQDLHSGTCFLLIRAIILSKVLSFTFMVFRCLTWCISTFSLKLCSLSHRTADLFSKIFRYSSSGVLAQMGYLWCDPLITVIPLINPLRPCWLPRGSLGWDYS